VVCGNHGLASLCGSWWYFEFWRLRDSDQWRRWVSGCRVSGVGCETTKHTKHTKGWLVILVEAGDARGRAPDSWFYEPRMTRMTVGDFEATEEHGISRNSRSGGVLSFGDCVAVISGDGE
jgi:hypothetical protein